MHAAEPAGAPTANVRSRVAVRLVFLAVALAYVVQVIVTVKVGEPYPALAMPTFAGAGGYDGGSVRVVRLEATIVTTTGKTKTVERDALLDTLPVSTHATVDRSFLVPFAAAAATSTRDGVPPPDESYVPLRFRLFPSLRAGVRRYAHPAHVASVRAWLAARARELAPKHDVERIELRWFADTFRQRAGEITTERELVRSVSVALDESR